jgi:hypothetical protein
MADDCKNAISTPGLPDFKAAISPYLRSMVRRVRKEIDHGTHSDWQDVILPSGIPQLERTIELDFNCIIPMPEPIKRTMREELSDDSPKGIALRKRNLAQFGFEDWYGWSSKIWGTKWNSYHGRFFDSDKVFTFCTAWAPPFPVLSKLAELLNSPLQLEYYDYEIEGRALFLPNGEMEHSKWIS